MKLVKFNGILSIIALSIFVLSSCVNFWYSVSIRTDNNILSVLAGGTLYLKSSGRDIEWKIGSNRDGSGSLASGTYITQNGTLTVDANESVPVIYVVARSLIDNYSDVKQVRVVTVDSVIIGPVNQTVAIGRSQQFRAQVTGKNNPDSAVTWSIGADYYGTGGVTAGTSISANGMLSVSVRESLRTIYIIATSIVDPTKASYTTVSIVVPTVTSVTVSAPGHSVAVGNIMQFSADVTGTYDPPKNVTWRVSSNAAGTGSVTQGTTINSNGLLSVAGNESVSTLYIFATSAVDPTKYGSISVNVTSAPVAIAPPPSQPRPTPTPTPSPSQPRPAPTQPAPSQPAPTPTPTPTPPQQRPEQQQPQQRPEQQQPQQRPGQQQPQQRPEQQQPQRPEQQQQQPQRPGQQQPQQRPEQQQPATPTPTPTTPPVTTPPPTTTTPPAVTTPTVTGVSISPASVSTKTNTNVQLSASVSGTNVTNNSVTWKVGSNPDGSGSIAPRTVISSSGRLTVAPNEWNPTLYVIATSAADPSKSAVIAVTITNANANQGSNQGS